MPFQRTKLLVCGAGAAATALVLYMKRDVLREVLSALCESLSDEPEIASDLSRDAFATVNVDRVEPTPGHTHPNAAMLRTAATNFCLNVATFCGSEVYSLGMSKSDQRKGLRGTRQWWWVKDVNAQNRGDVPRPSDTRFICDVDYYMDMPFVLVEEAKPVLLYTVVPEQAVALGIDDTSFTFDEDGALCSRVSGSGAYKHHLWDYGMDSTLAVKYWLGIPVQAIAYAIERKQIGAHRQVILLSPVRVFSGFAAILATFLLESKPLRRFDPVVGKGENKFVRFEIVTPTGVMTSTARPSSWVCATVPADVDASVETVARLGTQDLMLPTAATWVKDNRAASAVLTDYYRSCGKRSQAIVYPVKLGVRAYQYKPTEYDPEARPKLEAFMSPFVNGAFAPVMNKAGEERSVEGRINELKKPEPKPSAFVDKCMREFADHVMQGIILEPVCFEVVAAKQNSSTQKMSLRKAVLTGWFRKRVLKCFGKAEAYQDVKDPRNISQYNDADKLDMSMFALALSEHCKQFPWYGPGKTPLQIARRVTDICADADFVNISDYHRMDGTISYYLRGVDRVVCMKAFAHHRAKLNEILKTNVDNVGILPQGTTFQQGSSHGSGCPATSVFQTLRAAFTAYLAFRNQFGPGGNRFSPAEAFSNLGIHLGDDGLDANLSAKSHEWAAGKVGLVLEVNIVERGLRGVNFLARYYSPDVWTGLPDSMCDVKRQLSKFHTTVRLPANVTPEQKLVEKCMSYVATDGNTPVIGAFCKRVLLLSTYRPKSLLGVGHWWSRFQESEQYPNGNVDGWMDVEFTEHLPQFDRNLFQEWLDSTGETEKLLQPPLCQPSEPATPTSVAVVVDEDVVPPRGDTGSGKDSKSAEEAKTQQRRRTNRRSGKGSLTKSPESKSREPGKWVRKSAPKE